jgi:hypothetical protein
MVRVLNIGSLKCHSTTCILIFLSLGSLNLVSPMLIASFLSFANISLCLWFTCFQNDILSWFFNDSLKKVAQDMSTSNTKLVTSIISVSNDSNTVMLIKSLISTLDQGLLKDANQASITSVCCRMA